MAFKGFNTQYPEYEVITPQTKLSFTLRSLNVQEEERLKGSMMTPQKITEHLNKCLFDTLVAKPDSIKNMNDFLNQTSLKDRDALLYGLYHITYEEIRNYELRCTKCSNQYPVTVEASSTFGFTAYPGDNILAAKTEVDLPQSKGVKAVIKQPSLMDEIKTIKDLIGRPGSTIEIVTETLIIDSFKQDNEATKEPVVYSDRADILDAYLTLPAKDKRVIYTAYNEEFGQYGVELKMQSYCPACSNDDIYSIDLVENFFRAMFSA